jgi:ribonuclease P protein component
LTSLPTKKYNFCPLLSARTDGNPRPEILEFRYEANFSTKSAQARADPRLSCPYVDAHGAQSADGASRKGTHAPFALIFRLSGESADTSLPRQTRLRRRRDFRHVFAQPSKSGDSYFTVLARRNGRQPARLGLAISIKCAVRAVDRNRIKRVVRESFRRHRYSLHGVDVVVLCRPIAATCPNDRLFSSLSAHWMYVRDSLCVTS